MFSKSLVVESRHIDFRGVVNGIFLPYYMEWARDDFLRTERGIDIERLFEQGQEFLTLEFFIGFKKNIPQGEVITVTCQFEPHELSDRLKAVQTVLVGDDVYCEAVFVFTCINNGKTTLPAGFLPEPSH